MAFTDVNEVFANMLQVFNPNAAQGMDVVFQYEITGEGGGSWQVIINDGTCQVKEGTHDTPNVTLTMSAETWLAIGNKEKNGMQAFMDGQVRVVGDFMLPQRLDDLFPL